MAIEFLCPACNGTLSMPDDSVGRMVRCGSCMTALRVPDVAPNAPSEPEDAPAPQTPPPRPRPKRVRPVDSGDRDEHGEPRQRRSRKKSRGPLFWIVVILLGLGFFTCLACGGGTLILATPRWHTHHSAQGGFRVDFPAPVNPNMAKDARLKLKPNEFVEGSMLAGRLEFYWVWYTDFPDRAGFVNDEQILDETVKNMLKDGGGSVLKETPKKVDGYSAREVVIVQADEQVHHSLIVVGKSRMYVATAGGPFVASEGNERARRFLDSFHIEDNGNPWRGK